MLGFGGILYYLTGISAIKAYYDEKANAADTRSYRRPTESTV